MNANRDSKRRRIEKSIEPEEVCRNETGIESKEPRTSYAVEGLSSEEEERLVCSDSIRASGDWRSLVNYPVSDYNINNPELVAYDKRIRDRAFPPKSKASARMTDTTNIRDMSDPYYTSSLASAGQRIPSDVVSNILSYFDVDTLEGRATIMAATHVNMTWFVPAQRRLYRKVVIQKGRHFNSLFLGIECSVIDSTRPHRLPPKADLIRLIEHMTVGVVPSSKLLDILPPAGEEMFNIKSDRRLFPRLHVLAIRIASADETLEYLYKHMKPKELLFDGGEMDIERFVPSIWLNQKLSHKRWALHNILWNLYGNEPFERYTFVKQCGKRTLRGELAFLPPVKTVDTFIVPSRHKGPGYELTSRRIGVRLRRQWEKHGRGCLEGYLFWRDVRESHLGSDTVHRLIGYGNHEKLHANIHAECECSTEARRGWNYDAAVEYDDPQKDQKVQTIRIDMLRQRIPSRFPVDVGEWLAPRCKKISAANAKELGVTDPKMVSWAETRPAHRARLEYPPSVVRPDVNIQEFLKRTVEVESRKGKKNVKKAVKRKVVGIPRAVPLQAPVAEGKEDIARLPSALTYLGNEQEPEEAPVHPAESLRQRLDILRKSQWVAGLAPLPSELPDFSVNDEEEALAYRADPSRWRTLGESGEDMDMEEW
ncbi:hypothetical protein P7C73_g1437, partial [Tremellales sp. Uapishka_1]